MKKKTKYIIIASISALLLIGGIVGAVFGVPAYQTYKSYQSAEQLLQAGQYEEAKNAFWALGEYKDSAEKMKECDYQQAKQLLKEKKYNEAKELFKQLGDYSDAKSQITACEYGKAEEYLTAKEYESAKMIYEALGKYKDSADKIKACQYGIAENYLSNGEYKKAKELFQAIKDYTDAADRIKDCDYQQAGSYLKDGDYEQAEKIYKTLKNYKETKKKLKECKKLREEAKIQKVLEAYQEYFDSERTEYSESKCTLAYIDNDNIPELIMNFDNLFNYVCFYKDGKVYKLEEINPSVDTDSLSYIKKKNRICTASLFGSNGHYGYYKWVASSAKFEKIGCSMTLDYYYDGSEYRYYIGLDASEQSDNAEDGVSKQAYDDYNDSFGKNEEYTRAEAIYDTVEEAYEAIK